ncbi:hypothetical protein M8C21_003112 [Ambrosia artemisiifolia]|uniref:Uncharacterized protein n=1 Tax=Ambrosia artemisiifolia TaxID=4212 RepID=A0AAD5CXH5_AMBAR|nr:hypothetical protein M8C21_003112 [Ambrosia artemisiifolia]
MASDVRSTPNITRNLSQKLAIPSASKRQLFSFTVMRQRGGCWHFVLLVLEEVIWLANSSIQQNTGKQSDLKLKKCHE